MKEIITEFIKLWLKDIVVLFLVISLIDLIMPKGKMKRYIDFIIGILIIFTIINPLTRINNINLDLDSALIDFDKQILIENSLIDLQDEQVREIYTKNLKRKIQEVIEDNAGYGVEDIEIITLLDDERIFLLEGVNIVLSKKKEVNKAIKVDKVEIGNEAIESGNVNSNVELAELIASIVEIEAEKIKITMKDEVN